MANLKMEYAGNSAATTSDTNRMPSGGVWHNCPQEAIFFGMEDGTYYWNDFTRGIDYTVGETSDLGWIKDVQDTGTAVLDGTQHGNLVIDTVGTAADDGVNLQITPVQHTPAANRTIWYETRVKIADTPATTQFFAGLCAADTSIFAAGVNAAANSIGFEMDAVTQAANPGECQFNGEKATVRATVANMFTFADAATTTDNTEWKKLGFRIDGVTKATAYVDGVAQGTVATASIPIVAMALSFVGGTESTTDPIFTYDWVKIASLEREMVAGNG